ncbi:rhodanese-like domain-containing protein [Brachybacterium sp. Z12]|uniref:rhodanese-like domain-containing protein n=1 Tax=Brachybacterium sp. Z12 TaxID=2759167 RepID=UPI00292A5287|nr:rhodanese-like domain-containing protein [Brachybacterium sp. Z12]
MGDRGRHHRRRPHHAARRADGARRRGAARRRRRRGEVVLYCQGGVRSAKALERLRSAWSGREGHLRHLEGGYEAWVASAPEA